MDEFTIVKEYLTSTGVEYWCREMPGQKYSFSSLYCNTIYIGQRYIEFETIDGGWWIYGFGKVELSDPDWFKRFDEFIRPIE